MSVSPFKPLHQLAVLRDDKALSSTQRHVLNMAVLRTDNDSRRVRASQELLADDAGITARTVERALKAPAVRRYFVMEREGRRLNLTWRTSGSTPDTVSPIPDRESGNTRHSVGPSALSASSSARKTGLAGEPFYLAPVGTEGHDQEEFFLVDLMNPDDVLCPRCMWFKPCECES